MTATDNCGVGAHCNPARGTSRSYLATESNFAVMKTLETRNLVVPVVGDFGGPKAIRAIGRYLKSARCDRLDVPISRNVEQHLYQDNKIDAFCRNVATLPLDATSTFIRMSNRNAGFCGRWATAASAAASCRASDRWPTKCGPAVRLLDDSFMFHRARPAGGAQTRARIPSTRGAIGAITAFCDVAKSSRRELFVEDRVGVAQPRADHFVPELAIRRPKAAPRHSCR